MTTEEKKAFEKEMLEIYGINLKITDEDGEELIAKFRNSESYKEHIARAKELLSKARFPKGLFEQFGLPRPKFGQEIEVAM